MKGDVWQSRDFSVTVVIAMFTLAATLGAPAALAWLMSSLNDTVITATQPDVDLALRMRRLLGDLALWTVAAAAVVVVIGATTSAVQAGAVLSFSRIKPDLNHLNPVEGFKRIFAWRTLVELIRLLIKLLALTLILWVLARALVPLMAHAQYVPLVSWLILGGQQFEALLLVSCLVFGALGLADLAYQRWDYMRRQRMSKEEVLREYKEREGDPILRGRRKQLHQEINFNNMLQKVRTASVVIVNPTHVAVALHYDPQETPVPMVVAKGEGEVARAIRQAAEEAGVPIYRDVSLARTLQGGTPLNDYIPDDLMEAVAHVLQWVDRMKKQEAAPGG
jgi:flagellar biosynthesis protein FlhB